MPNIDDLSIQFKANGTETAIKNIKAMGYAVRNLAMAVKAVDTAKLGAFTSTMETVKKSVPTEAQVNRMVAFSNAIKDFSGVIGSANISGFSRDMSTLGEAMQTFKKSSVNSITNAVSAMQNLQTQTQETATTLSNSIPKNPASIKATDSKATINETRELVATLDKVQVKATGVQGALQKMGMVVPTKKFKGLEESAEKIRQKYDEVRAALQKGLNEGSIESGGTEYRKKMAELDALRNKYNELIQKQKELSREGSGFTLNPNITKAYSGVQQSVMGVKKAFGGVSSIVNRTNKYIDSFIGKLRSLGRSSKSSSRDTSTLTEAAKKLSKELFRVSKMLKLMVTRMALRAVIKEVGNGFKSLALHSEEFNNSMSSLINGSKKLGYSFAAMISPLINAFAPAIVYVINLLTKLVNIIQQVFGALTGAGTWNKAKDFTDSWADSISGASKDAKELKKTVLGFDELNQLQEKKDSGGGAGDIKDMFETMPIESKWKDLANKIKDIAARLFDPIKKAWEKVGDFVKDSWKYAMDEVLKLGKSIARDFWKVWQEQDTQKIFENIFETIGWIGVAIGNLAKRFREAWDYNETGLKILRAIRDIVLIVTEHVKNMAKATAEWADSLNFKPLLTSIQQWLESLKPVTDAVMGVLEDFYNEVVLKFTKWVLESGLPQLIDVFKRFNEEVDWDGLRSKLAELWKHLEPFMETVGEGLIIFIERVTKALAEFINGEQFASFLDKLGEWMDSVEPEDVADAIERLIKALIGFKVVGAVISVISGVAPVISAIVTACQGLGSIAGGVNTFVTAIGGLGGALLPIAGVVAGVVVAIYSLTQSFGGLESSTQQLKESLGQIGDIFSKIATDLGVSDSINKLKESVSSLLTELGDMKDYWTVILSVLGTVVTVIGGRLITVFNTLIQILTDVANYVRSTISILKGFGELIVGVFTGNGEKIKQGWQSIWNGVIGIFKSFIEGIAHLVSGLVDLIVQPFKTIKYMLIGDPIVIDMWNGITKVFSDGKDAVCKFVTDLKDGVIKLFTDIQTSVVEKVGAIMNKLTEWKQSFENTKNSISQSLGEVKEQAKSKFEEVKTNLSTFKDSWQKGWSDAKKNLDDFKRDGSKILSEIKDSMSEKNWTFEGVGEGLTKTFEKAKKGIKGIWNSIAEKLNGEHDIGEGSFRINLPTFATGGFPEDGLFMANHNELVGHFSNGKTAVANNDQIIAGIETGVYSAVSKAMAQNNGGSQYISNEIIMDGEVVARSISKAQNRQNMRYSPQTV